MNRLINLKSIESKIVVSAHLLFFLSLVFLSVILNTNSLTVFIIFDFFILFIALSLGNLYDTKRRFTALIFFIFILLSLFTWYIDLFSYYYTSQETELTAFSGPEAVRTFAVILDGLLLLSGLTGAGLLLWKRFIRPFWGKIEKK